MASDEGVRLEIPCPKAEEKHEPLPEGKYTIVAIDIDTTGKRLIDEIVQVATYCPNDSFSQYIMPLMNLNPAARQRHQVRVITVGFFRMLKSMQNYRVMKTKTEVAALKEFLTHLEKIKEQDEGSKGIILVFHEQRKFVPYMLIEAMKKYNFLPRFLETVKSFFNTHPVSVERCGNSMKYFSLRQTHKVLINPSTEQEKSSDGAASIEAQGNEAEPKKAQEESTAATTTSAPTTKTRANSEAEPFEGNASVRAQLVFDIGQQLALGTESKQDITPQQLSEKFMQLALCYGHSVDIEIEELKEQERILERQSSLRPIFLQYFRTTLHHRVKAVTFRRVLAELGFDMEKLQTLWNAEKKEGLVQTLAKTDELRPEDREELTEILDHFLDPAKPSVRPRISRRSVSRRRRRPINNGNADDQNNNQRVKNKENMGQSQQGNNRDAATGGGDGPKKQRSKRSPRRSFRRSRVNRGLAASN